MPYGQDDHRVRRSVVLIERDVGGPAARDEQFAQAVLRRTSEQRMQFQEVMRDRFMEVIEGETGRKVVAFMSGSHQDPDLLAEVFVLEASDLTD